ncbi:MAG: ribonuclease III [Candidatus Paceibacterota bacterium]
MADISEFEKKIEISFSDKELLRRAFTHRSYINEVGGERKHNERLEFLGDAVLELVITHFLFDKYPDTPEGELTAVRAALVNTQSIAQAARELGMNEYLLLSRGEERDTGRARHFILANTYEAVIGAIYLDQGYDAAHRFIQQTLFHKAKAIVENKTWHDPKSRFQELAQEHESITPTYKVLKEEGPDHDKHFTIGIFLEEEQVAQGEGQSKQEAEQEAAKNALEERGW